MRHRRDLACIQFRILTTIGQKTRELRLVESVATQHQNLTIKPLFKEVIHAEMFKKTGEKIETGLLELTGKGRLSQ
ncbi:hypothetical protein D3C80_1336180 [compost metagenome]